MSYPDTTLESDVLDPEYGGQSSTGFGAPAWKWINSVVRFLSRSHLAYQRVPYQTIVVVSQTAAIAGDVATFAPGLPVTGGGYDVRKYQASLTKPRCAGIYLEPVSAGAKARVIVAGIVPTTITGLGSQAAAIDAGLNVTTSRCRAVVTGDVILGTLDLAGNMLLTGFGVALP